VFFVVLVFAYSCLMFCCFQSPSLFVVATFLPLQHSQCVVKMYNDVT